MVLLKGFIRKGTTKIYIVILTGLLITIITLFSIINYYNNKCNEIFKDSSEMFVISTKEFYNNLNKNKKYTNLREVLVFKPNYSSKVFGIQCEQMTDAQTGFITDNFNECDHDSSVKWIDLLFDNYNSYIVVVNDSDLLGNQVIIGIHKWLYEEENYKDLIGKEVSFYFNDELIEFKIKGFSNERFPKIYISSKKYDKLFKKNKVYGYLVTPKYFFDTDEIYLNTLDNIDYAKTNTHYEGDSNNYFNFFYDMVNYLTFASYIIIIIFIIVIIVVTKNSIMDETEIIKVERLLGYNLNQIRKYLSAKIITLNFITIILSLVGSILINMLINFSEIKLIIINFNLLLKIYGGLLLVTSFLCIFYGVKIGKKSNNYLINRK